MQGRIQQIQNIKIFRSAVRLCAAISEEQINIITGQDKFQLKASNDSLTSSVTVEFVIHDFFSEFHFSNPDSEKSEEKEEKLEAVLAVAVKSRLLLQSMRLLSGIKVCHMGNYSDSNYFSICFTSDEGCSRVYYFVYEETEAAINAVELQNPRFRCCVKPKFLNDAIRSFSSKIPEIQWTICKLGIKLKAWDNAGDQPHLKTELFLNAYDIAKFEFDESIESLILVIPCSEIRAMIQFCQATDTLLLLECQEAGLPTFMTSVIDREKINFRAPPFSTKLIVQTVFEDCYVPPQSEIQAVSNLTSAALSVQNSREAVRELPSEPPPPQNPLPVARHDSSDSILSQSKQEAALSEADLEVLGSRAAGLESSLKAKLSGRKPVRSKSEDLCNPPSGGRIGMSPFDNLGIDQALRSNVSQLEASQVSMKTDDESSKRGSKHSSDTLSDSGQKRWPQREADYCDLLDTPVVDRQRSSNSRKSFRSSEAKKQPPEDKASNTTHLRNRKQDNASSKASLKRARKSLSPLSKVVKNVSQVNLNAVSSFPRKPACDEETCLASQPMTLDSRMSYHDNKVPKLNLKTILSDGEDNCLDSYRKSFQPRSVQGLRGLSSKKPNADASVVEGIREPHSKKPKLNLSAVNRHSADVLQSPNNKKASTSEEKTHSHMDLQNKEDPPTAEKKAYSRERNREKVSSKKSIPVNDRRTSVPSTNAPKPRRPSILSTKNPQPRRPSIVSTTSIHSRLPTGQTSNQSRIRRKRVSDISANDPTFIKNLKIAKRKRSSILPTADTSFDQNEQDKSGDGEETCLDSFQGSFNPYQKGRRRSASSKRGKNVVNGPDVNKNHGTFFSKSFQESVTFDDDLSHISASQESLPTIIADPEVKRKSSDKLNCVSGGPAPPNLGKEASVGLDVTHLDASQESLKSCDSKLENKSKHSSNSRLRSENRSNKARSCESKQEDALNAEKITRLKANHVSRKSNVNKPRSRSRPSSNNTVSSKRRRTGSRQNVHSFSREDVPKSGKSDGCLEPCQVKLKPFTIHLCGEHYVRLCKNKEGHKRPHCFLCNMKAVI